jgi:hypothetical protein
MPTKKMTSNTPYWNTPSITPTTNPLPADKKNPPPSSGHRQFRPCRGGASWHFTIADVRRGGGRGRRGPMNVQGHCHVRRSTRQRGFAKTPHCDRRRRSADDGTRHAICASGGWRDWGTFWDKLLQRFILLPSETPILPRTKETER